MDRDIQKVIGAIIVWVAVMIGTKVMKKIQPEDKVYPVWAVMIGIIFTIVVIVL